MQKNFLLMSLIALWCGVGFAAADRPNVIVIFTDDHGFADLSIQGVFDDLKTPHIDKLAAGGVRMTSGYVTAPQCVPSRAGILSGRYQNRFGVESNGKPLDGFNAQSTIAERLKKVGYATGMTGKWHLGAAPEIVEHGFDDVYYKNSNRPGWANFDLDGTDRKPGPEHSKLYHLDANSAAACAFIRRHHDEPFFFYCAYRAPHVPLDAPPKYLKRFPGKMPERRRQALAMISAMDDGVGKIIATLRELKVEERTLIFFIGDNGAPLKIHKTDAPGGGPGWDGSLNDPMNGEKGMLAEGGIRVPFVVYWKGRIEGGREYDHPVSSLDVAATSVALAGLPDDSQLDGVNLMPFLTDKAKGSPHESLYWRWVGQSAIREGKWKYLRGGPREYLFDLDADVGEKRNILKSHPEIAGRLRAKLNDWSQKLDPPGLETKSLSTAASRYFDFYLDGKQVDGPDKPQKTTDKAAGFQGWVVRGGSLKMSDGAMLVVPDRKGGKRSPFLAQAKLKTPGPAKATIQIRSPKGGKVGFAWRLDGQTDFQAGQSAYAMLQASDDWQDVSIPLDAKGRIIHIRVLLPPGTTEIRRITLTGANGKRARVWNFGAK
jgi:arylsulfatase A-like enzyme